MCKHLTCFFSFFLLLEKERTPKYISFYTEKKTFFPQKIDQVPKQSPKTLHWYNKHCIIIIQCFICQHNSRALAFQKTNKEFIHCPCSYTAAIVN